MEIVFPADDKVIIPKKNLLFYFVQFKSTNWCILSIRCDFVELSFMVRGICFSLLSWLMLFLSPILSLNIMGLSTMLKFVFWNISFKILVLPRAAIDKAYRFKFKSFYFLSKIVFYFIFGKEKRKWKIFLWHCLVVCQEKNETYMSYR